MNARLICLAASGFALTLSTFAAVAGEVPAAGRISCVLSAPENDAAGQKWPKWQIELDDSTPLAVVDDSDTPADYSPYHVRIRLSYDGPVLTIGRVSGRILASDNDGTTLGVGRCTRPTVV
jgi:hypothetical protein